MTTAEAEAIGKAMWRHDMKIKQQFDIILEKAQAIKAKADTLEEENTRLKAELFSYLSNKVLECPICGTKL